MLNDSHNAFSRPQRAVMLPREAEHTRACALLLGTVLCMVLAHTAAAQSLTFEPKNASLLSVPVEPQEVYAISNRNPFTSPSTLTFVIDDSAVSGGPEYTAPSQLHALFLQNDPQFTSQVVKVSQWNGSTPAIIIAPSAQLPLSIHNNQDWIDAYTKLGALYTPDGYRMMIESGLVVIAGSDSRGAFYGAQTLRALLTNSATIAPIVVRDWPDLPIRAALTQQTAQSSDPEGRYDQLAYHRFNALLLDGPMWFNLTIPANNQVVQQWMAWCRKYYLDPVPHLALMGHAREVLKINPAAAEGFIAIEEAVLSSTADYVLQCRNVIDQSNCPIQVQSLDGNTTYVEGTDYVVYAGTLAYGYSTSNTPWKIRAIASRPTDGHRLRITYTYIAPNSESSCPVEPATQTIADNTINAAIDAVANAMGSGHPRYIHLGCDEIRVLGQDRRSRSTGLSNAYLLANEIGRMRQTVYDNSPTCKVMVWADTLDLHQHAFGLDTIHAIDLLSPDKTPQNQMQDIILCHWWYGPGELDWMNENMIHSTSRSFQTMGTVWNNDQNAYEWTKQTLKKYTTGYNWGGLSRGVILGAWGGNGDPWASVAVTGAFAWGTHNPAPNLPVAQKDRDIHQMAGPVPTGSSLHMPVNETFDALDWGTLPIGWQWEYSPNAITSQRYYGTSGKSFEVSGDALSGLSHRGARMYLDHTYGTGYLHLSQQVYIDSATAGTNIPKFFQILGPGFANRVCLRIVRNSSGQHVIQRDTLSAAVTVPNVLFPVDQWVRLDILVNIDQRTWSAWMDNGTPTTIFTNQPYVYVADGRDLVCARWISNTNGDYNRFWIDDVKIEYYPSSQVLLALNGSLADSGTANISSITRGTHVSDAGSSATFALNQSMLFAPTSDTDQTASITIPDNAALDVDSFTITSWLRPQSKGKGNLGMSLYDKLANSQGVQVSYSWDGNKLRFFLQVNGTSTSAFTNTTTGDVIPGSSAAWVFSTITYDATTRTATAYFGDVATPVYATPGVTLPGSGPLHPAPNGAAGVIGFRSSNPGRALDGHLDDFRIFNRVLTLDEIKSVRRSALPAD